MGVHSELSPEGGWLRRHLEEVFRKLVKRSVLCALTDHPHALPLLRTASVAKPELRQHLAPADCGHGQRAAVEIPEYPLSLQRH